MPNAHKILTIDDAAAGYRLVSTDEREHYSHASVFCDGASIRYWLTPGSLPTNLLGKILYVGQTLPLANKAEVQSFLAIREGTTNAVLSVDLLE